MSAQPLDLARDRRGTERYFPRFRPCDRFWSQGSDTSRQAVMERKLGPQTPPFFCLFTNKSALFTTQCILISGN